MNKPDIQRLLEFQRILQQFNQVDRAMHRKHQDEMRLENDTEHSYNLAMTVWYLSSYFPNLNQDLMIRYALVHDFLEVYSGDTYIFGTAEELASQSDREKAAADKLKAEWTDFADLHRYIEEYESLSSPEARFVYALDKFMPIMTIFVSDGYTWKHEDASVQRIRDSRIAKVELSAEIKPYFEELCALLLNHPELLPAK